MSFRLCWNLTWLEMFIGQMGMGYREQLKWIRRIMGALPYKRYVIRTSYFQFSISRGWRFDLDYRVHPNKARWLAVVLGWFQFVWIINEARIKGEFRDGVLVKAA